MSMTAANREALIRQIARLEAMGDARSSTVATVPLLCPAIDDILPDGGLRTGALHEVMGPAIPDTPVIGPAAADRLSARMGQSADQRGDGAVMGFTCALLARLMQAPGMDRPVVWCMNRSVHYRNGLLSGQVYGPGLHMFGIPMQRLLFVYCNDDQEALWATEEAVRSAAAGAVVAELHGLEAVAARRLQLATQASATTALAIRPGSAAAAGGFVETRWRVASLASLAASGIEGIGGDETGVQSVAAHWHVALLRVRRSPLTGSWAVRWHDQRLLAKPYHPDSPAIAAVPMTRVPVA